MMHVAWAGDSQAMLFRKGHGLQLVDPHKPDREVSSARTITSYYVLILQAESEAHSRPMFNILKSL